MINKTKYGESFHLFCVCGDLTDHVVVFQYFPDEECQDYFVHCSMNNYLPWYRRVVVAIRYVFKRDTGDVHYEESALNKAVLKDLKDWLETII